MPKHKNSPSPYRWLPGTGVDAEALQRLKNWAPLPHKPMGEAWFMSEERKMYDGLLVDNPRAWPDDQLQHAIGDLSWGPSCFGHMPEWSQWFLFLLPRVIELIDEWRPSDLTGAMVSAVLIHFPAPEVEQPYSEFRDDVLATLGRVIMEPRFWIDGRIACGKTLTGIESTVYSCIVSAGDAFSASLFLALKYLDLQMIEPWLASVVAIPDPVWRTKYALWLAEVAPMLLEEGRQPSERVFQGWHGFGWQQCWSLKGSIPGVDVDRSATVRAFLDTDRRKTILAAVRGNLSQAVLSEWRIGLENEQSVCGGLEDVIGQFEVAAKRVTSSYVLA